MKKSDPKLIGLAKMFGLAKTEEELAGLLHDLFTESEIEKAYERVGIFDCLDRGSSQREVVRETGSAIATVSHGAKFLNKSAVIIREILGRAKRKEWWRRFFQRT